MPKGGAADGTPCQGLGPGNRHPQEDLRVPEARLQPLRGRFRRRLQEGPNQSLEEEGPLSPQDRMRDLPREVLQ